MCEDEHVKMYAHAHTHALTHSHTHTVTCLLTHPQTHTIAMHSDKLLTGPTHWLIPPTMPFSHRAIIVAPTPVASWKSQHFTPMDVTPSTCTSQNLHILLQAMKKERKSSVSVLLVLMSAK